MDAGDLAAKRAPQTSPPQPPSPKRRGGSRTASPAAPPPPPRPPECSVRNRRIGVPPRAASAAPTRRGNAGRRRSPSSPSRSESASRRISAASLRLRKRSRTRRPSASMGSSGRTSSTATRFSQESYGFRYHSRTSGGSGLRLTPTLPRAGRRGFAIESARRRASCFCPSQSRNGNRFIFGRWNAAVFRITSRLIASTWRAAQTMPIIPPQSWTTSVTLSWTLR